MFRRTIARMAEAPTDYVGATGSRYQFGSMIQEKPYVGRVWLAKSGKDKFILKDIPRDIYDNFTVDIRPRLWKNSHIRLPCDSIPGQRIFVYKYMTDDFLSLVKRGISTQSRKQILKASLLGIAELHEQHVVHLDFKPDDIMVDCRDKGEEETVVKRVLLTDLENAAYLPEGRCIKGMLAGNDNWRSPEAHFRGELNKPTNRLAFGIVCLYAVLARVIFGIDDDFRFYESQGALPAMIRLQRQVSYFGDKEGINGLLKHIGNDEVNCQVLRMLWDERSEEYIPYKPFSQWEGHMEPVFRDLIRQLMNLSPAKRLTAREVLENP
ncbi:putative calcium/calmodulin dependent protein kinase [Aspergillus neoniger CBS 115656]|uniref:Calcium/calmodulin dependent protein kinase n=1 Tax=Aspergillus neoniger (strain CBS 115656) TaxID=1448310 RepID=A0A318Z2M4_ASPNB|nr:putative calcium/calmodulin dependent protein kinase [Aspergillus neoniger CBS 115656]PYH34418.1 putative calcium/calmodulin dependent protein kinase [Aspergillus neoniger CBS 115656]